MTDGRDHPLWTHTPPPGRTRKAGEILFEFVRASDRAPMSCELRFHGESYGWEAQFLESGELLYSRGAFMTRALAVQWAEVSARRTKHDPKADGSCVGRRVVGRMESYQRECEREVMTR